MKMTTAKASEGTLWNLYLDGRICGCVTRESDAAEIVRRWNTHPDAMRLLKEFADHFTGPCELDHHGNCQAHMLEEKCSVKEARELLAACGKEQSNG